MPLDTFRELMGDAEQNGYAVGYFESWDLGSLLAVADAAERMRSPVILGFSGIYLPHPARGGGRPARRLRGARPGGLPRLCVPACLLFNESPDFESVVEAIDLGYGLVMYSDDGLDECDLAERVARVVALARAAGAPSRGRRHRWKASAAGWPRHPPTPA